MNQRTIILTNKVRCLHCGGIAQSKYRWDYAECKCGSVAADGGIGYLRRKGVQGKDYKELSEVFCIDTEFDELRKHFTWTSIYDKDSERLTKPVKRKLCDMDSEHIKVLISMANAGIIKEIMQKELEYRKQRRKYESLG